MALLSQLGITREGQCNVESWTDIKAISVYNNTTLGLKEDGTVVATGNNKLGNAT
jgi:alpha-tubulin suppressor-like RCC1 family protein